MKKLKLDKEIILLYLGIILLALTLRLYLLDIRPAHFDEGGGHAKGALSLLEQGTYTYNPDFHGPFLYHITALSFKLLGINDITLRLPQALFGIFLILLLYPIRSYFSKIGFLTSASLLAISPSLVYYSRFALHDSFFVFFTLATIVSMFLYDKYRKNIYIYLFAISLAFLFTVKENVYIFLGILGIYFVFEFLYEIVSERLWSERKKKLSAIVKERITAIISWVKKNPSTLLMSIVLFSIVFSALFTSFFRFPNNLGKAIMEPYFHWFKKSTEQSGYVAPYIFYLKILTRYDFAIFFLGILGLFVVFFENNRFARFVTIWSILTLIIYLFMPYKLPNNIVNVVLPFGISAGLFVGFVFSKLKNPLDTYTLLILAVILLISLYMSVRVSFVEYSNEKNPLVFVQTVDDIKPLLKLVEDISYRKTGGKDIDIVVSVSQTEYPLSWYWHDYPNVRYHGEELEIPSGWKTIKWSGDGELSWATDYPREGNRSVKISAVEGADAEWRQKISVVGGYRYMLSGWIRTDGIEPVSAGKYAKMYVRTDKNDNPNEVIGETDSVTGTNNWTYVETEFSVGKGESAVWLTMTIGNWGRTRGSIWFDNISLTREGSTKNFISNPSFEEGEKIDKFRGTSIIVVSETSGQTLQPIGGYDLRKYTLRPGVELAVYFENDLG